MLHWRTLARQGHGWSYGAKEYTFRVFFCQMIMLPNIDVRTRIIFYVYRRNIIKKLPCKLGDLTQKKIDVLVNVKSVKFRRESSPNATPFRSVFSLHIFIRG